MSAGTPGDGGAGRSAVRRCPVCGKPAVDPFMPFCSKRHADIDLHRWLADAYTIPASPDDGDGDDQGSDQGDDESGQGSGAGGRGRRQP